MKCQKMFSVQREKQSQRFFSCDDAIKHRFSLKIQSQMGKKQFLLPREEQEWPRVAHTTALLQRH